MSGMRVDHRSLHHRSNAVSGLPCWFADSVALHQQTASTAVESELFFPVITLFFWVMQVCAMCYLMNFEGLKMGTIFRE